MARKEKKYHFIYKTTNLLSGKYYIGMHSTNDLNDGYMGSGKRLRYSINKYGKENHKVEIVEFFEDRKKLKKKKKEIVNLNEIAKEECMNLMTGGEGGLVSKKHHRKMMIGLKKWLNGKWQEKEFREKNIKLSAERMRQHHRDGKIKYDTFTGKNHTKESKEKMSKKAKARIGNKNSQFGTCWITKENVNKKIKKEELNIFLQLGWSKGRKTK